MISRLWRWLRRAPKPGARVVFVRLDPRLPADGIMAGLRTCDNAASRAVYLDVLGLDDDEKASYLEAFERSSVLAIEKVYRWTMNDSREV